MAITVFKRYEKKFLLTEEQYREILPMLLTHMRFDKYCINEQTYGLLNVYFDTPENLLIERSTDKPVYKEKLRLRSYFIPKDENSTVFFEIKQKYKGCVTKRRAVLRYGEALEIAGTHKMPALKDDSYINVQVVKEILRMFEQYEGLAPALYISYDRLALFDREDPELRVTFDRNIRTRRENPGFDGGLDGELLLPPGYVLMEIKIPETLPLWFARYLSDHGLYMTSFSKFGKEYEYEVTHNKNIILAKAEE